MMDECHSLPTIEEQLNTSTMINREARTAATIIKIEDIICSLVHDLVNGRRLSIPLKTRKQKPMEADATNARMLCFPGRIDTEAWRFGRFDASLSRSTLRRRSAVVIRILSIVHKALVDNKIINKRFSMSCGTFNSFELTLYRVLAVRAIFYQDPELFSKQSVVDRLIDDLAFMFEVQRSDLNVVSL